VLTVLQRMRNKASANPELYDPDAQKRIEEAMARVGEVLRDAQAECCTTVQPLKVA
jgi:hypothetical protein